MKDGGNSAIECWAFNVGCWLFLSKKFSQAVTMLRDWELPFRGGVNDMPAEGCGGYLNCV